MSFPDMQPTQLDVFVNSVVLDPDQPLAPLQSDENEVLSRMRSQLRRYLWRNRMLERRYEASHSTAHMDISVPPQLPRVEVVAGWGGKVVDKLEERIDFRGWVSSGDIMGLDRVYEDNYMAVESSRAHVDSLLYGISFIALGTGDPSNNEPDILVTAESSLRSTMLWDQRSRRALAGYTATYDYKNKINTEIIYMRDKTITMTRDVMTGKFEVTNRDNHNKNFVPMIRMVNRDRASNPNGRSEITPPIRYFTDAAVRTLLGLEVNREFGMVPMTFALNVRPEAFGYKEGMSESEKARLGWKIMMGHVNIVPPNEKDEAPADVKQLSINPPTPYIEQVKMYAQLVSDESGLPLNYFGLSQDIAPNADSIKQQEYPLVRRAERRIVNFNHSYKDLAFLTLLWRDGDVDIDALRKVRSSWRDPNSPTRSAQADEATKLTSVEILIPDSKVTYDRVGLSLEEQAQLEIDKRKFRAQQLAQAIATQAAGPDQPGSAPGGVKPNQNGTAPGSPKNPANVARGQKIATQNGQG